MFDLTLSVSQARYPSIPTCSVGAQRRATTDTLRAGGTLLLLSGEQLLYFVQLHERLYGRETVDVQSDNQILHL